MTFNDAYEELENLADGRPFSLQYERASYIPTVEIIAYIEGVGHGKGQVTYQGAIDNMRIILSEPLTIKADEAPLDGGGEADDLPAA